MRREILISMVFLFLLISITANEEGNSKVGEKVIEELQEEGKVEVVVVLKEEVTEGGVGILSSGESKNVVVSEVVEDLDLEKESEFSSIKGFSGEIDSGDLKDLLEDERVEKVYFKHTYETFLQDSIPLINASVVHALSYGLGNITGKDQGVCILDTGLNYSHVDFGGCSSDEFLNGTCSRVIGGHDYENNDSDPMDDQGHGTHVAGIAVGNGSLIGVAPEAFVIPVKVCNNASSATCSYVQEGLDWCVNNSAAFNISVISLSLGSSTLYESACDGDSLVPFVNAARDKNISVVAASGNAGNYSAIASPACITNVTAVGWSDKSDAIATNSNRNSLIDLFASGSSINATAYTGDYEVKSGTSMATPHVAGAIALLKQYYNDTNLEVGVSKIVQELRETGKSIFDSSSNLTFYRIDVHGALNDTANPNVTIRLSSSPVEIASENLTINVDYVDAFLDSRASNVSYPNGTLLGDFTDTINLSDKNLTDFGTYTIVSWANDTNYNENITNKTFKVQDTSGLDNTSFTFNNVNANGENFTDNETAFFNVTIKSKYNLTNATLYHNHTSWGANESESFSDLNETTLEFNASFGEGVYLFGVHTCDVNNHCVFSDNKTLYVDQSDPVVNLVTPSNASSVTVLPIDFTFNVTDYGISSCTLTFNGTTNETLSNVGLGNNVFTEDIYYLPDGGYNWSVNCIDNVDKNKSSDTWEFTLSCGSSFTRDCTSYSACSGGSKTRLCYDANYCVSTAQNQSSTSGCSSSDDDSGSGGGDSGGSGGGATTTTSADKSTLKFSAAIGDTKTFGISKDVGVSGLELKFKKAVDNVEVTVEKQESKPDSVSAVEGVYKYLKINSNLFEDDLEEAVIKFKVPKSWILINAYNDPTRVRLKRYVNEEWVELETLTAGTEEEEQKYEAITPGFSFFAISADKSEVGGVGGDVIAANITEGNETIESEAEEEGEEKGNVFSRLFTGGAIRNLVSGRTSWYYGGGLVLILVAFLGYRFRSRLKVFGFLGRIGLLVNKIPKMPIRRVVGGFRRVEAKVGEEESKVRGIFRRRHKDKIGREKERLQEERERLEEEKKEIEKFKREEGRIMRKKEKEERRREKEEEKRKRKEEKEQRKIEKKKEKEKERRLNEERKQLREEEKKVKAERKLEKKREKEAKEEEEEAGFNIKHSEEEKWEDLELEDED